VLLGMDDSTSAAAGLGRGPVRRFCAQIGVAQRYQLVGDEGRRPPRGEIAWTDSNEPSHPWRTATAPGKAFGEHRLAPVHQKRTDDRSNQGMTSPPIAQKMTISIDGNNCPTSEGRT